MGMTGVELTARWPHCSCSIPPFLVRANWHCKTSGPHHPVTSTKNAGVKRLAGKHLPSFSYVNQRQVLWGWNFTHTHKYFSCSSWAACLGLAVPFGEGERVKRRGRWDRWKGEKVGETDGDEYFKSLWKRKEYVTDSCPKLRNEKLHKLLFTALSYTSSHCPNTLAFQQLCFLQVISNLITEEIPGCCGYNRSMLTRKHESQLIL